MPQNMIRPQAIWHDGCLAGAFASGRVAIGIRCAPAAGERLSTHRAKTPSGPGKTAAVLVALLDLPEPEVVLTRRAEHLPQHPGQVSFPGGAAEAGDSSAVQTALREAHEEIGLPAEVTTPIGFLDRMDTISDYRVLPVVALVKPPVRWIPDEREVAEVFTSSALHRIG